MQIRTDKDKQKQMRKEARASILLYIAFFVWWYVTGYGIADAGTPETYTYVLGLPMWFVLSSVVGYVLFCVATILLVKIVFKDFSLEDEGEDE